MIDMAFYISNRRGPGNLGRIAHDGAAKTPDADLLLRTRVRLLATPPVRLGFGQPIRLSGGTRAMLPADDAHPLDVRDLRLRERVRRDILALMLPAGLHTARQGGRHA